jgi:lysophospholipase L1-like esterase
MTRLMVFGDSIAHGHGDSEGGWFDRLKRFLEFREGEWTVHNLGVSGDTVPGLLARVEVEASPRMREDEETVLLFQIGLNDSQVLNPSKKTRFTLKQFEENLEKLVRKALRVSSKVFFLGLTPVDDSRTDPMPWAPDKSYFDGRAREFSRVIEKVCREHGLVFVGVREKFGKDFEKLLEDGAHPNSRGHELIFGLVKKSLREQGLLSQA